uniref:Uncharacterized protein n=1 Tax=Steinernema glaseri TaxID=37863 RepID=A0A1I7Z902_9BILA
MKRVPDWVTLIALSNYDLRVHSTSCDNEKLYGPFPVGLVTAEAILVHLYRVETEELRCLIQLPDEPSVLKTSFQKSETFLAELSLDPNLVPLKTAAAGCGGVATSEHAEVFRAPMRFFSRSVSPGTGHAKTQRPPGFLAHCWKVWESFSTWSLAPLTRDSSLEGPLAIPMPKLTEAVSDVTYLSKADRRPVSSVGRAPDS